MTRKRNVVNTVNNGGVVAIRRAIPQGVRIVEVSTSPLKKKKKRARVVAAAARVNNMRGVARLRGVRRAGIPEHARNFVLKCLDPYRKNIPVMGVPDGCSLPTFTVEHTQKLVITAASTGDLIFGQFASLPSPLFIFAGSATWGNPNVVVTEVVSDNFWSGIPLAEYEATVRSALSAIQAAPGAGTNRQVFMNQYFASAARLLYGGLKVKSTGTISNTTGSVVVCRTPTRYTGADSVPFFLDDFANLPSGAQVAGTNFNQFPCQNIAQVPGTWSSVAGMQDSTILEVIEGAVIPMVRQEGTGDWNFSPVAPYCQAAMIATGMANSQTYSTDWTIQTTAPIPSSNTVGTTVATLIGDAAATTFYSGSAVSSGVYGAVGSIWNSDSHSAIIYAGKGLPANWPVEIEVTMCMEYQLEWGSPDANAAKPSMSSSPAALEAVNQLMRQMPIAVPYEEWACGSYSGNVNRMLGQGGMKSGNIYQGVSGRFGLDFQRMILGRFGNMRL
jgi:hypothetical protein